MISPDNTKAREEFDALLDSNREDVRARRDTIRQRYGKAVSPQQVKFLRKQARRRRKDNKGK